MCGFAGLLSTAGFRCDELIDHARRMIAPIAHRGPDDSGIWADERAGVAFGFRRLAILDLSPQGHQPMRSPSGRFTVVYRAALGLDVGFNDMHTDVWSLRRINVPAGISGAAFEAWAAGLHGRRAS